MHAYLVKHPHKKYLKERAIELHKSEEEINNMNDDLYVNINQENYEKFDNNSNKNENQIIALRAPAATLSKTFLINENSDKFSNQNLNSNVLERIRQAQILSPSLKNFYSKYEKFNHKLSSVKPPFYEIYNKSVENNEYFELNNKKFQSEYEKAAVQLDDRYYYENHNIQEITTNIHHLNLNEDALDEERLKITNKFNKNLFRFSIEI